MLFPNLVVLEGLSRGVTFRSLPGGRKKRPDFPTGVMSAGPVGEISLRLDPAATRPSELMEPTTSVPQASTPESAASSEA